VGRAAHCVLHWQRDSRRWSPGGRWIAFMQRGRKGVELALVLPNGDPNAARHALARKFAKSTNNLSRSVGSRAALQRATNVENAAEAHCQVHSIRRSFPGHFLQQASSVSKPQAVSLPAIPIADLVVIDDGSSDF